MNNKIAEILNARRLNAQTIANNKFDLASCISSFKPTFSEYKKAHIEMARKQVFGESTKKLAEDIDVLKSKLETILLEKNLKIEDLEPEYECKVCKDTGYVCGKVCNCVQNILKELNNMALKNDNLHTFKDANLKIFENDIMPRLYKVFNSWLQKSPRTINNFLLQGGSGVGKTFLLECVASELILQNKYVVFTSAFELNNNLLQYHTTFDNDKMKFIGRYLDCDALIIDDLGTEPVFRNVTREYLYLILNQRMIENKITLFSTNLDLDEIKERYNDRIFSRIINKGAGRTFKIQHSDLRLKKQ